MTQIIVSLIQALADKLPETTPKPILTLKTTFDHLLDESAQLVGAERSAILLVDQQGPLAPAPRVEPGAQVRLARQPPHPVLQLSRRQLDEARIVAVHPS